MKCDQCDKEATVHEVTVKNGVKIERHLCESCAASLGIPVQAPVPLNELMSKFLVSQAVGKTPAATPPRQTSCPGCGQTFNEFRKSGLLGCPRCYAAFVRQLAPLIERAHEGGVKHIGKHPRRAGAGQELPDSTTPSPEVSLLAERAERLKRLRADLEAAIKTEKYEVAARLRDELKKLNESTSGDEEDQA